MILFKPNYKTMKQLFFIIISLLGAVGHAQDKNFDLSKYKFPDYKRHELEFSFNSNGSNYKRYYEIPATSSYKASLYDDSESYFNSHLQGYYYFTNYKRNRIDWINTSIKEDYQFTKSENVGSYYKNSQPHFETSFSAKRRNYITEDKFFWEGSTHLGVSLNKRKITYDDRPMETSTSNYFSFNAGIGIGTGRIEHVNDLWQGYYILEKLKNQNSIKQELKEDDVYEFSRFISKLNNKRFFDYRLRKIAELQALDSVLRKQNLIINDDITYFTTLNDYWSFPIYFDRKTGKEVGFNVMPQYYHDYDKSASYKNTSNAVFLESKFYFDHSKQINLNWERDFHFDLINTTLLSEESDENTNTKKNQVATNASFDYGYFPNTRTRVQFGCKYQGNEFRYLSSTVTKNSWMNTVILDLDIAYFISPQVQAGASFSDRHWFSPLNSTHGHEIFYNLSFRYAIF